ncbi:anthrone oxygenase family protein [Kitasatospora sp. NPDC057904]|uniref:anthrone oxygenase family protein n=1 Tax=unclassified Kitasatospora TaxID=2633591 RepID=UPI0036DE8DBE
MNDLVNHGLGLVALLGSGIVSGVFFAVAISVIPTAMALSVDRYVEIHKLLGRHYDPTMPIIVISAGLADFALGGTADRAWIRVLTVLAGVALAGVAVVSRACNVPINRQVKLVESGAVPEGWRDPRPLWRDWHHLRTALAMVAFVGNAVAVTWGA